MGSGEGDACRIVLSAEEYDALVAKLDEPPEDKPKLRELLRPKEDDPNTAPEDPTL